MFKILKYIFLMISSGSFLWLYMPVLLFIYFEYRRMNINTLDVGNDFKQQFKDSFYSSVLFGLLVGVLISLINYYLGITLYLVDAAVIFFASILFNFVFKRSTFCYTYSVAIDILIKIMSGEFYRIPGLILILAEFYIIQSLLVLSDGCTSDKPVLVGCHDYTISGAYCMNRTWAVPSLFFIVTNGTSDKSLSVFLNIINQGQSMISTSSFIKFLPFVFIFVYNDFAYYNSPQKTKSIHAFILLINSVLLAVLSYLSLKFNSFKFLSIILIPLMNEILIAVNDEYIKKEDPYFGVPAKGLRVLQVEEDGIGYNAGLRPADIILSINGINIKSEKMLQYVLDKYPYMIFIEILKPDGQTINITYRDYEHGINDLGISIVPRQSGEIYRYNKDIGIFTNIIKKFMHHKI